MADEKKKPEEEQTAEGKPKDNAEAPAEGKKDEQPKDEPKADSESEKKPENEPQTDKNGEGDTVPDEPEKPPESQSEDKAEGESAPPELSEEDKLREENFRLKTQLEAMKIGFNPDVIEDAVVLAENIVKKDGSDISTALQAVAKKYPDWKADSKGKDGKSKGGFRVGADSSGNSQKAGDERLNNAFGIRNH